LKDTLLFLQDLAHEPHSTELVRGQVKLPFERHCLIQISFVHDKFAQVTQRYGAAVFSSLRLRLALLLLSVAGLRAGAVSHFCVLCRFIAHVVGSVAGFGLAGMTFRRRKVELRGLGVERGRCAVVHQGFTINWFITWPPSATLPSVFDTAEHVKPVLFEKTGQLKAPQVS
jgi:hypothetical protein